MFQKVPKECSGRFQINVPEDSRSMFRKHPDRSPFGSGMFRMFWNVLEADVPEYSREIYIEGQRVYRCGRLLVSNDSSSSSLTGLRSGEVPSVRPFSSPVIVSRV